MELINKKKDVQGTRYYFAGCFNLITEDWQQKNKNTSKKITKIASVILLFIMFSTNIKAQEKQLAIDSAFTFQASYIGDWINNIDGGIKRGEAYLGMAKINASFETEKAKLYKGGQIFINAVHTHGNTPSADIIGDFQVASNIEAGTLTYIQELWYKQNFGKISATIGLQDLNVEFNSSESPSIFINSSFGNHSTIASNINAPIFPYTSVGINLQYQITQQIKYQIALFDGCPDDYQNQNYNLNWKLNKKDGILAVSEITINKTLIKNLSGIYKIGAYSHNHFQKSKLEKDSSIVQDNYGLYLLADQEIFNNKNNKKISIFAQASISPSQKNINNYYLGIGLNYYGIINKRPKDILGLAIANAGFNKLYNKNETAIELTYKAQINKFISIQPDLQYIINPSGTENKLNNATLLTIRFNINF